VNPNALFAADIARIRDEYITEAGDAVMAAHMAGSCGLDVVRLDVARARELAGERWNREHPQYRIGEAA
jgi:hypothetical protein